MYVFDEVRAADKPVFVERRTRLYRRMRTPGSATGLLLSFTMRRGRLKVSIVSGKYCAALSVLILRLLLALCLSAHVHLSIHIRHVSNFSLVTASTLDLRLPGFFVLPVSPISLVSLIQTCQPSSGTVQRGPGAN